MGIRTILLVTNLLLHAVDVAAFLCPSRLAHSSPPKNAQHFTTFAVRRPRTDISDFTIIDESDDQKSESRGASTGGNEKSGSSNRIEGGDNKGKEIEVNSEKNDGARRQEMTNSKKSPMESASWMDRNKAFSDDDRDETDEKFAVADMNGGNTSFRENFRGTRVFVTGLPVDATWQDLKDHFRRAGEVVFASVSADMETGRSKGYGVVQYETTHEAQRAIEMMRDFPLNGSQLYVRQDVQEKQGKELSGSSAKGARGPTPPSKWKCANEENVELLSESERRAILSLIKARDDARRRRQYDASDTMREELKMRYNVHVDDRLKMWWSAIDGNQVPNSIRDIKGEGKWGDQKPWRQIPTTAENDACVDPDLVNGLLTQRDIARREKDFKTADMLLEQARVAPSGELFLRIHDQSRTWRIWTNDPPPKEVVHRKSPADQCLEILDKYAPHKVNEMKVLLEKFPGREYSILKKLKQLYLSE